MAFSIQTNVNSLVAQENLRVNSNFQSQTIQRLTSGYRINSSGDDAAGLAIANKFRSDTAELTQGVRNANDGVAQLQIMDGGMNNIGKMLDRLKTLATQSASSTFTGDRSVLNSEYQTLVGEIDRQAQGIGLSTGGHFATRMGVYIGGGTSAAGTADTANGTVSLNLANSVVDSKALGLRTSDFEVDTAAGTDIGAGSATSVSAIETANDATDHGKATFNISGPGFNNVSLSVNIKNMTQPQSVADAINAALGAAANGSADFQKAGIAASVKTNDDGTQQLVFSSTGSAFQVTAGTATANALLGNFKTGTATPGTGADSGASYTGSAMTNAAATEPVVLRAIINGTSHDFTVNVVAGHTAAGDTVTAGTLANDVATAQDAGTHNLAYYGITVTNDTGNKLKFVGPAGSSLNIEVVGDQNNALGLGSWQGGNAANANVFSTSDYSGSAVAAVINGGASTATLEISLNGGDKIAIHLSDTSNAAQVKADINTAAANNATLKAAGLAADWDVANTKFSLKTNNNVNFRFNVINASAADTFDMKLTGNANIGTAVASTGDLGAVTAQATRTNASGSAQTELGANGDVFSFSKLVNAGDQQTLSFSAVDSTGAGQATSITLKTSNAGSLDDAISAINTQLQTNNTLKNIVAVKERNQDGTGEGIRFLSSLSSFSVKVGDATNFTDANPVGMFDGTAGATAKQGMTVNSSESGSMDITTVGGAQQAVVALGQAVQKLGSAQAAIGKGQNQLGYAISLANSQISNFSSAQSQIRDADVAAEAANLSKAQVLQQASIAAMAQANSAPQAVLALLRG